MSSSPKVRVNVEPGDALDFNADVLALKYAQALYGLELAVQERIGIDPDDPRLPKIGSYTLFGSRGQIAARRALFIGVEPLHRFGYLEIREFGRRVLSSLSTEAPSTRHVAVTLHGPGYGLDEGEAFEAEIAGFLDALTAGDYPEKLETISIVEKDARRAQRLTASLDNLLPHGRLPMDSGHPLSEGEKQTQTALRGAGYASASKPHVFVAMPFAEEMDDTFHYGIRSAVNAAGMLCERADLSTFAGDIMDFVRRRISTATLVVADLSTANPNVYLEVGYAWGCGVRTVLLAKSAADLKFDIRSHRCIFYKSIRNLEETLRRELQGLVEPGAGPFGL